MLLSAITSPMRDVVFYTRPGCHLCDDALREVLAAREQAEFSLREVDIAQDQDAFDDFKFDIPVVEVDGVVAFKHRLTAHALLERLR